jgi:hypothetical protein
MLEVIVALALFAGSPSEGPAAPGQTTVQATGQTSAPAAPPAPPAPAPAAQPQGEEMVCKRIKVQTGSRLGRGERVCRPASQWLDESDNAQREANSIAGRIPARDPTILP